MAAGLYSGVSGLALGTGLYRNVSGLWSGSSGLDAGFGGGSGPFPGASLYLNFLDPTLDSRITFSRGSNATLVDSTGQVTYAPANLLLRSQEIAISPWVGDTSGGSIPTATANAGVAPDGTNTATRLQINRGAGTFSRWQQIGIVGPVGFYLASVWMRTTSGTGTANVGLRNDATGVNCVVTGTWQRFSVMNATAINSPNVQILSFTSIPGTDVSADILVWGAQLEPVTYQTTPGPYVATTASAYYGPRFDYDPVTLAPRGLLIEEQRTNLFTYSDDWSNAVWTKTDTTVSANATAVPDGTTSADKLVETATTAQHRVSQSITTTAATHAFSCYVKAAERNFVAFYHTQTNSSLSVNLTTGATGSLSGTTAITSFAVTPSGNGWYRISVAVLATAAANGFTIFVMNDLTTASYAGTAGSGIFLWGAQLEAGAFATSYIPTVASTVTRSADVATMTGTNFSSWYNQAEGSFVASFDVLSTATASKAAFTTNDTTSNNINIVYVTSGGSAIAEVRSGGSSQATLSFGSVAANTVASGAFAYRTNDFAASLGGGAVSADTLGATALSQSALNIGYASNYGGLYLNGHIRQIAYYNTRLPNTQLQTLTAPSLASPLALDFLSTTYTVGY